MRGKYQAFIAVFPTSAKIEHISIITHGKYLNEPISEIYNPITDLHVQYIFTLNRSQCNTVCIKFRNLKKRTITDYKPPFARNLY